MELRRRVKLGVPGPRGGGPSKVIHSELWRDGLCAVHENAAWFLRPVSRTFHGRDIFAPVTARLAGGGRFSKVGPRLEAYVRLPWPDAEISAGKVRGVVVYIDRFGNGIINIPGRMLENPKAGGWHAEWGRGRSAPVKEFYQAVPAGRPVAVAGSGGFLEIAVNDGSAARALRLKRGDRIVARRAPDDL